MRDDGGDTLKTGGDRRLGRAGFGAAALFAILPPAAAGGGMLLAPLQALIGLVAAPAPRDRRQVLDFLCATAPLLLFALWAAASLLWSAVQRPEQAARIVGGVLTGVLFVAGMGAAPARDRTLARAALVAAIVVLIGYSAIEAGFDMPLNRLDHPGAAAGVLERNPGKGVSILVTLVWGGVGALIGGKGWRGLLGAALLLATGALSLQFHMATNAVGFACGAAGLALGWLVPRIAPLIVSGLLAAWVLAAPWLTPLLLSINGIERGMPLSWRMRGEIWQFARARIEEKPWFGWGLDGARQFGGRILTIDGLDFRAIPLHPHSFSYHVWLETGAVGAALMAAAMVAGGIAAARTLGGSKPASAAVTGAIAAIGMIWNVSYGAWQEWWIATAFIALGAATLARRDRPDTAPMKATAVGPMRTSPSTSHLPAIAQRPQN